MDGLRKINQRRRAFGAAPMKASRRKFAYGGFVDANGDANPEPVEQGRPSVEGSLTVDQPRDYLNTQAGSAGMALQGLRAGGKPAKGDRQHPAGKALGRLPGFAYGGTVEDEQDLTNPQRIEVPLTVGQANITPPPTSSAPVNLVAEGLRTPKPPQPRRRLMPAEMTEEGEILPDDSPVYLPPEMRTPETERAAAAAAPPGPSLVSSRPVLPDIPQAGEAPVVTDRTKMLSHFGLREGTTRESEVPGAPGVKKYVDPATGKTLYSNTTNIGVMQPTEEQVKFAQGRAKADSDRLTGIIRAKTAAGDPQSLEEARQLAVTPEQRAMIGEAQNLAGLRQRAGRRGALAELTGRAAAEVEGLRGNRALMATMLARTPTPLQVAQEARAVRGEERAASQQERENALKEHGNFVERYFGTDDKGKAQAADFWQNLNSTLPALRGGKGAALHQLTPTEVNGLLILNELRKNAMPGTISSWLGNKPPSRNLLDILPTGTSEGFWNTQVKTPQGSYTLNDLTAGNKALRDFLTQALERRRAMGGNG